MPWLAALLNVDADDELAYAAALCYRFGGPNGKTEIGVDLDGGIDLHEQDSEELPLEALGYLSHAINADWEILGGPGIGVLAGYGVPTLRGFVGVRFTPTSHGQDGDRISDRSAAPRELGAAPVDLFSRRRDARARDGRARALSAGGAPSHPPPSCGICRCDCSRRCNTCDAARKWAIPVSGRCAVPPGAGTALSGLAAAGRRVVPAALLPRS